MPLYILIEYRDNHSKASEILWQFYRDKSHNSAITNSESFKSKVTITRKPLIMVIQKMLKLQHH